MSNTHTPSWPLPRGPPIDHLSSSSPNQGSWCQSRGQQTSQLPPWLSGASGLLCGPQGPQGSPQRCSPGRCTWLWSSEPGPGQALRAHGLTPTPLLSSPEGAKNPNLRATVSVSLPGTCHRGWQLGSEKCHLTEITHRSATTKAGVADTVDYGGKRNQRSESGRLSSKPNKQTTP